MASQKQKITPRAMLELQMPGEVQVASDNTRIAYTLSETDWDDNRITSHIYVVTTAENSEARQVTRGASGESFPLWSPDSKWLAFYAAREDADVSDEEASPDDDPKQQVYLLPMDGGGGEAEPWTDAPEGVLSFEWLPDSSGIVYLAPEPRRAPLQALRDDKQERKDDAVVEREEKFRVQVWQSGRADKKATLAWAGDLGVGEIAVSPDGKTVAYVTNYTGEVNDYHKADVWVLTLESGETRQLTDGPGGKFHPVWTPDGQSVLFTQPEHPALSYSQENLYSVPIEGGAAECITQDFAPDLVGWRAVWFDSEGTLYVSGATGTTTGIYKRTGDGFVPLVVGDETVHDFHVGPGGGIAYVVSSSADVPEVLWLAPGAPEPAALTDHNEEWQEKYQIEPTHLVRWPSTEGLEIESLLTLPLGYKPEQSYPLIVNLHGGPHGRATQSLTPYSEALVYAARGYCVLSPNYRGSEGYGSAFSTANQGDLGGGDFRDVMAGVDWAIAEGIADAQQLAVMGASYGGYLTNWCVGHTDRFRAAVSKFGIFSLATDFSNSQAPRWEQEYLGGFPWERADDYARLSPAASVADMHAPMLILHGEGDGNTFIANSQELYTALRLLGRTVQYAHYPREGHGFAEPQHRLDEFARCLAWFDRYLVGDGQPRAYRTGDKILHDNWELTVASAVLQTYAGRGDEGKARYVEVAFVLRDLSDAPRPLAFGPDDALLTRAGHTPTRRNRPVGLPLDVLGEKVLAEGTGWKLRFTPPVPGDAKGERRLAVPIALAFRIGAAGGTHVLAIKGFPVVLLEVPAAEARPKARKSGG